MIIALIPTITTSNLENLFQQTFIVNYKKKKKTFLFFYQNFGKVSSVFITFQVID